MIRIVPILVLLLPLAFGCSRAYAPALAAAPALAMSEHSADALPSTSRMLVHRAEVRVVVADPAAAAAQVHALVDGMGGYVESSTTEQRRVVLALRVPAARLDEFVGAAARWGELREKRVATEDVTDRSVDLEARIRNLTVVRDRLRTHLANASQTQDVIAVERELARVQSELESLQARFDRIRSDVAMSRVDLQLERRRVLGPVGLLAAGAARVVSWLFVIR